MHKFYNHIQSLTPQNADDLLNLCYPSSIIAISSQFGVFACHFIGLSQQKERIHFFGSSNLAVEWWIMGEDDHGPKKKGKAAS